MANMTQSLSMNTPFGGIPSASVPSIAGGSAQPNKDRKMASAEQLVLDLSNPELRENALLELSKVKLPETSSLFIGLLDKVLLNIYLCIYC